ncbi:MAG: DUF4296 domain-containing protein [Bacteroidia bacterium]|nr:DUF4296 domain-containing protein [Bacteroidia bacterium]
MLLVSHFYGFNGKSLNYLYLRAMRIQPIARVFLFFAGLFIFTFCKEKSANKNKPPNLIAEEAFVNVLVDFSICESASSINIKQVSNLKFDSVYAFNPLAEHKIRKGQYDSTLSYYAGHIDEYKAIYEAVLERIAAKQAELKQTKP